MNVYYKINCWGCHRNWLVPEEEIDDNFDGDNVTCPYCGCESEVITAKENVGPKIFHVYKILCGELQEVK
jgi:hypothetical protein